MTTTFVTRARGDRGPDRHRRARRLGNRTHKAVMLKVYDMADELSEILGDDSLPARTMILHASATAADLADFLQQCTRTFPDE